MIADLRLALRLLIKSPGFTVVAVLTLGLGIGSNTAIFSVVNGVLLRPLALHEPDRIVRLLESQPPQFPTFSIAPPNFVDWKKTSASFESLAAYRGQSYNLTGEGEPMRLVGLRVTAEHFTVFGVAPLQGRDFLPEEDTPAGGQVAILSHVFWQRQFGGAPDTLGRSIELNGNPHTIIGIMPQDFSGATVTPIDLWTPMAFPDEEISNSNRGAHYINAVGRLKPGVTIEQAQSEMNVIAAQLATEYPDTNKGWGVSVFVLPDYMVRDVRLVLWTLLGAVACVLLIACANVANLLLARANSRMREISIRSAMGAGRWRIVRQLLTESVVLALLGGAAGVLFANWGLDVLLAFAPANLPRASELGIDGGALGFAFALSLLTGIVFGAAPAWLATGHRLNETLKEGSRGSTEGGRRWFRQGLVIAEVALALLLLTGAGLLVRSYMNLSGVDPGFDPTNATVVNLSLPDRKYDTPEKQQQFADSLVARVRELPGVVEAGITHTLPLVGDWVLTFVIEGRPEIAPSDLPSTNYYAVSPGYFRAMGIRIVRGRGFSVQDTAEAPRVALINETFARMHFPGEDPIGKRIYIQNGPESFREIVGIVSDVKQYGIDSDTTAQAYDPFAQNPFGGLTAVIRTSGDPAALQKSIRAQVFAVDPAQPVSSIRLLTDILAGSISRQRFAMLLITVFSLVALVISAVGIYGVVAYSVSQRTGEIGIRMALGATGRDVLSMVLRQNLIIIAAGLVLGLLAAISASRVMQSLLYRVSASDPLTLGAIAALLGVIGFFACLIPARRATKVDPMTALRAE
ncbi:MAG TPA: ABC transporter permease [Opitutaceae bacterium]|nr:ABC transporter permease [Opitutaceae bacterium]